MLGNMDDLELEVLERTSSCSDAMLGFELGLLRIESLLTNPFRRPLELSSFVLVSSRLSPWPKPTPASLALSSIATTYGLASVVTSIICFNTALSDIDASVGVKFNIASNGRCVGSVGGSG